jgi:hypothetical protein
VVCGQLIILHLENAIALDGCHLKLKSGLSKAENWTLCS